MKQQINEKIRVAICPHTKKPVLQQYVKWEEQSSWLCLHNENEKKDADEVLLFNQKKLYEKSKTRL